MTTLEEMLAQRPVNRENVDAYKQRMLEEVDAIRNSDIPSWTSVEDEDPMAMVLVVNTAHDLEPSEQDVVTAAAHATMLPFLSSRVEVQESVRTWLKGRIRKIVKRARNKAWDDLALLPEFVGEATYGDATVRVFMPQKVSTLAAPLRKLQVSGLSFPRRDTVKPEGSYLEVVINDTLEMTTGKTVAQIGHAVQLFLMRGAVEEVAEWLSTDQPLFFRYSKDIEAENLPVEVHDAGFTEVASNSYTAGARYVKA